MNWEDFKKAIKEKPWILGLLIISGIVVIYLVLRTRKKEEPTYMPAGQVITPEPVAGGGSVSGSVPSSDTGLIADMLTGFAQAQGQALASMAEQQREAIQSMLESITKSQSEMLSKITQSQRDLLNQMQTALKEIVSSYDADLELDIKMYKEGQKLAEWISESPRERGGAVSAIAELTAPLARRAVSEITGKTGTIESQLSGMTMTQKLEILKKAGLIR